MRGGYGDTLLNPRHIVPTPMARLSRVVIPGVPHHVTQRGNGRQQTFFEPGDYGLYLDLSYGDALLNP